VISPDVPLTRVYSLASVLPLATPNETGAAGRSFAASSGIACLEVPRPFLLSKRFRRCERCGERVLLSGCR
jgi:hypothetical protein